MVVAGGKKGKNRSSLKNPQSFAWIPEIKPHESELGLVLLSLHSETLVSGKTFLCSPIRVSFLVWKSTLFVILGSAIKGR